MTSLVMVVSKKSFLEVELRERERSIPGKVKQNLCYGALQLSNRSKFNIKLYCLLTWPKDDEATDINE